MITKQGISLIAKSILNIIDHAEIIMDKDIKRINLYKTSIEDNNLKVFIMLDDTFKGKITETKLISKQNQVLIDRAESIDKNTSKGLLIIFNLKISEV